MVRRRADVDGCGCSRCQNVDPRVFGRSLAEGLVWSGALPFRQPSILVVCLCITAAQLAVLLSTTDAVVGALVSLVSAVLGRGYIAVVGRAMLARAAPPMGPVDSLRAVLRRFPSLCAAAGVVLAALGGVVGAVTMLRDPVRTGATALGLSAVVPDVMLVLFVAAVVLYALVKFCFLPEACFVGGYGPVAALRASWGATAVHRERAIRIAGGFALLLAVGVALDSQFADPTRPVALAVRYRETTVAVRSVGFAAGPRVVVDFLTTLLYSGVFVHQYVQAAVDPSDSSHG